MTELPVSEVFGPTFQGEGPYTGRVCSFVRLGHCNLSCEWCDTPYTWDRTRFDVDAECPPTDVADIGRKLEQHGTSLVVVSGGEPLIHHHKLEQLFALDFDFHVETNGTIPPPAYWTSDVQHTTVSPKIGTGDPAKRRIREGALGKWAQLAQMDAAAFKFVVTSVHYLLVVDELVRRFEIPPSQVWIMPEGTTPDAVLAHHRQLADLTLERGYNTTTRLHTLLWGDERGH